jgi:polyhydroxybutyrate depolymerase
MPVEPARRRTRLAPSATVVVVVVVLALTGCTAGRKSTGGNPTSGAGTVATGSSTQTLTVDGRQRTFRLYLPPSLPLTRPVPLVLMLHGGFGSAEQAESSYGWDAAADSGHFVVVYPNGLNRAWNVGGGCCGQPGSSGVDDVGFVHQVVGVVSRELPIDPARVFATGISNGGMFAYRLACDTTLFAAIGPDSATLLGACPSPAPLSVIHIHGTADQSIPYDGGQGNGFATIDGSAVPAVVASWRAVDDCLAPQVSTSGPVTRSVAGCPGGRSVELITIAGAGHQWPGAAAKPLVQKLLGTDPPSTALDATATIWQFFAAHPKPAA